MAARTPIVRLINFLETRYLSHIKTPAFIIFFVTNRCNANCKHCFYKSELNLNNGEIALSDIKKVAVSLRNNASLLITGGEPFLREDLFYICEAFYRNRVRKIRIATNGFLTDRIVSISEKILKNSKVSLTIQVSLDAVGERHDSLRGLKGLFAKAGETIEALCNLKSRFRRLKVSAIATVYRNNYDEVVQLSGYVKGRFGLTLGLTFVREYGLGVYNLDRQLYAELPVLKDDFKIPKFTELRDLVLKIKMLKPKGHTWHDFVDDFSILEKMYELGIIFNSKRPPFRCTSALTDAAIYPDGGVSICEITKPFTNLSHYNYSLYKIWNSKKAEEVKKKLRSCFCSHPCHLTSSMSHNANFLLDIREKIS